MVPDLSGSLPGSRFHHGFAGFAAVAVMLLFLPQGAPGENALIECTSDTSLMEVAPEYNAGWTSSLQVGTNTQRNSARILFGFDVASTLPPGAVILRASLQILVLRADPFAAVNSPFELRRVLVPWNEGTKTGLKGGPSEDGEPSWDWISYPDIGWSEPGGLIGVDYSDAVSSTCFIKKPATYVFDSTPEMAHDVQTWLDAPDTNFGWMMRSQFEGVPKTARRVASREDTPALLSVDYYMPDAEPYISGVTTDGNSVVIQWTGGQGPYLLQRMPTTDGPWENYGVLIDGTTARVTAEGDQAYFRVLSSASLP
ncbi:MAG TPA: hypothetical protein DCM86_09575 [Verrucomicrobiales bacterium]|nr:hypothetical protein [Verrucomicrobiales bacterium]